FDPRHVYLASFELGPLGYSQARALEFDRQLLARVRALPGVQAATLADFAPLNFTIHSDNVQPQGYVGQPHESMEVDRGSVAPGYLQTLGTPLLAGREFTAADTAVSQPVTMVNQALVDRYWPGQDAIGKHIQLWGTNFTVVGVIGNAKYRRLVYGTAPLALFPLMQRYQDQVILEVRTAGDPMAMAPAIARTVHDLNADLPLYNVTTLKSSMRMGSVFERLAVIFATSFGLLAMLLAAVGVYGVVAYTARQRTHEIGIRMALGAARGDIFRQVLRQGAGLTLAGIAGGLVTSLLFTRFLRSLLFGVGASDWITFCFVAVLLSAVALAACLLPARRAAGIEPMQALRRE
ncbi:MAG: FtsX-like permease family protein, partial [Acidobacteriota bacterium]